MEVTAIDAERLEDLIVEPTVDWDKVFSRIPNLKKDENPDLYVVRDALDDERELANLIVPEVAVEIEFDDGSRQNFTNQAILRWHRPMCEGYRMHADDRYVYFVLIEAAYQAGSLGIWDFVSKEWVFTDSGPDLCTEGIVYLPVRNAFVGVAQYVYPVVGPASFFLFLVENGHANYDLDFKEVEPPQAPDLDDWRSTELWSIDDPAYITVDPSNEVVYLKTDEPLKAFVIPKDI